MSLPASARPLEAVLFDLDGTLVDTLGDFHVATNAMLRAVGRPELALDVIGRMVGKGSDHLLRSALIYPTEPSAAAFAAIDPALYERAWTIYQTRYAEINGQHCAVFPGVRATLAALRERGMPLACLTNKPIAHARDLLRMKALDGFFQAIFGGDSFARKKPDPLPLLATCQALGSTPAHTLMVGDSVNDARAARAAGSPVVLVSYGYNHGRPVREIDADAYLDDMAALPTLLG